MLYAFGSNNQYQLGLDSCNEDIDEPEKLDAFQGITLSSVASGGNHTLFLSETGQLYGAGSNRCSELGIRADSQHLVKPQLISGNFKMISCGWQFSLALAHDGCIYSTGSGPKGELGLGPGITQVACFTSMQHIGHENASVTQLSTGLNHAVAVLSDGTVYGWGYSRKGQLGTALASFGQLNEPRQIECSQKITDVACGREYTVLGNRNTGYVQVLGPDRSGVKSNQPRLNSEGFKRLKSGWSSAHILTTDNHIISWGNNSNGQCLTASLEAVDIAIGSEHGLAVDKSGSISAWGWGQHGNCGAKGKQGSGPWRIDIPEGHKVRSIHAGHANSWIQY